MKTEILAGPERRRRWSAAEKEQAVGEALMAGANVASIARRYGVSRSLVYAWRREARPEPNTPVMPALVPVIVAPSDGADAPSKDHEPPSVRAGPAQSHHGARGGVIEIALAGGVRVTLRGPLDVKGLRAVLAALRG